MRTTAFDLRHLPDDVLLADLRQLVRRSSVLEAELLVHLVEVDARQLYLARACSSLYTFCTGLLQMSEGQAYRRMHAARAARRFPLVLDLVGAGRLHLSAVSLLAPHLTDENHRELLEAAVHKSKREVEKLVATRFPKPDVADSLRKAPARGAAKVARPAPVGETAPVPVLKATVSQAVHDKLLRAQALLRHSVPGGELEQVLDRALDALLDDLSRDKLGHADRPRAQAQPPRAGSRRVRASSRREAVARDGERCSFVDPVTGRRCEERGFLEFDHITPVAKGGSDGPGEVRVYCAGHNHHAAVLEFGERFLKERVAKARAERDARRAGEGVTSSSGGPPPVRPQADTV